MQIAGSIGGYSMACGQSTPADEQKKPKRWRRRSPSFSTEQKQNSIPQQKAQKIWDQMETFAEYGFNKSHSAA